MMKHVKTSFFGKRLLVLMGFALLSFGLRAQTAYIYNNTDCDMVVLVYGMQNCEICGPENIVVEANSSESLTLTCGASAVGAVVSADVCPSGSANVFTTACACSIPGSNTDSDCFTMTSDCCYPEGTPIRVGAQCYNNDVYVDISQNTCP